ENENDPLNSPWKRLVGPHGGQQVYTCALSRYTAATLKEWVDSLQGAHGQVIVDGRCKVRYLSEHERESFLLVPKDGVLMRRNSHDAFSSGLDHDKAAQSLRETLAHEDSQANPHFPLLELTSGSVQQAKQKWGVDPAIWVLTTAGQLYVSSYYPIGRF